jgi:hypothetical protein
MITWTVRDRKVASICYLLFAICYSERASCEFSLAVYVFAVPDKHTTPS